MSGTVASNGTRVLHNQVRAACARGVGGEGATVMRLVTNECALQRGLNQAKHTVLLCETNICTGPGNAAHGYTGVPSLVETSPKHSIVPSQLSQ